jgi:uncharacterized protein YbjT (DUF2867 family)
MSGTISSREEPVLVVGGTGDLGGRAVRALLARGKKVRALVRPGSDPSRLVTQGVDVVRGDMLEPASLGPAMIGVSAVVSTAIGYSHRRETDSLRTDTEGNRNLVDAARKYDVPRFVFQSILTCDLAESVPHFWPKKLTEDHLEEQGLPFVSLRPGAFLGGPWMKKGLEYGGVIGMTPPNVRITFIDPDEVARVLALSIDEPRALGKKIDLGSDRPLSSPELAELLGRLMGRTLQIQPLPQGSADMTAMAAYFATGKYVADTRVQEQQFPPVPKIEETARKMLREFGLLAA